MNNYVDKAEFFADMVESQDKGFPTEAYALKCQLVASKMLQGKSFRGYSDELKEDLAGNALVKCMRAIHTFDRTKTQNVFGYITRTCYTSFLLTLKDHYKQINIKKKLIMQQMSQYDELTAKSTLSNWENNTWKDYNGFNE